MTRIRPPALRPGRLSPSRAFALFALFAAPGAAAAQTATLVPAPLSDPTQQGETASAQSTLVIAGGCFWGVQAVFQHVKGVQSAVSGYAGGSAKTAHYETVGSGATGHAESVEIAYDPRVISAGRLLRIFFSVAHDPTELNRQGPDTGTQYRSAIFFSDPRQEALAKSYVDELNRSKVFGKPIATSIEPLKGFYPAEAYHQNYLTLHPDNPYIVVNDRPKIEELKRLFPDWYRETPLLVGGRKAS